MSASTAKATRHQIRKAFGPEAVDVLATLSESSRTLGDNLNDLRTGCFRVEEAHSQRLSTLEACVNDRLQCLLSDRIALLESRPLPLTFWQRLRWLVTGR